MEHQIVLTTPDSARTSEGDFIPGTPFATGVWASIIALQGRERDLAQAIVSEVTHRITIPYMAGVTTDLQVSFDSRMFDVQAVQDPDERQTELRLLCVERDGSGG